MAQQTENPTSRQTAAKGTYSATEGFKDSSESIVVAFILAFVFRAFVIEAFVIPTGSMAATLYGQHGTAICSDCGWEYAYGLGYDPQRLNPLAAQRSTCPNCNNADDVQFTNQNAQAGDRILVFKWPFDVGGDLLGPKRWDVTVFKNPKDGTTNFIKRLIGLPNEVLEIIDGDVYTVPTEQLDEETLERLRKLRHHKYEEFANPYGQSSMKSAELADIRQKLLRTLAGKLTIARQSDQAQEQLWFNVYDHDFLPHRHGAGAAPRWAALLVGTQSNWDTSDRRVRYDGVGKEGQFIQFAGKPIVDTYAYNLMGNKNKAHPIQDLRLKFVFMPEEGDGRLLVSLSKGDATFWASMEMNGKLSLIRTDGDLPSTEKPLQTAAIKPPATGQPVNVEFVNVDYRVSLKINGEVVLETTPEQYHPEVARLRHHHPRRGLPPRIYGEDIKAEIWHLSLARDAYYRSGGDTVLGGDKCPPPWRGRPCWGGTGNPIWLGEKEYFMLGDNSPQSADSRLWVTVGDHLQSRGEEYQVGTVPRDQLIGKAFFVYWPSGQRFEWIPALRNVGIIPDVGRMRWIR